MWQPERHQKILALLQTHERLSTETAAQALGVSRETIRRDLIELEQEGRLSRVHGGAVTLAAPAEPPYAERARLRQQEKRSIARLAAAALPPGSSCFIDAGSTTLALAEALLARDDLQIVTNAIEVAMLLRRNPALQVTLLGGRLGTEVSATFGEGTIAEIDRLQLDWAVVSPTSLDPRLGAMNYDWQEATVARAMLAHARQRLLLADAAKLGQSSRVQVCACSAIDLLITEAGVAPALLQALRDAGVRHIEEAP